MTERMLLDANLTANWTPNPSGTPNFEILNLAGDSKQINTLVANTFDRYSCEDLDAIVGDNTITELHGHVRQYQRFLMGASSIGYQLRIGTSAEPTKFVNLSNFGSSNEPIPYDTPFDITGLSISPAERRDMNVRLSSIGLSWIFGAGFESISEIYFEVTFADLSVPSQKIKGRAAVRIVRGFSRVEEISGRSKIRNIDGASPIPALRGRSKVREIK